MLFLLFMVEKYFTNAYEQFVIYFWVRAIFLWILIKSVKKNRSFSGKKVSLYRQLNWDTFHHQYYIVVPGHESWCGSPLCYCLLSFHDAFAGALFSAFMNKSGLEDTFQWPWNHMLILGLPFTEGGCPIHVNSPFFPWAGDSNWKSFPEFVPRYKLAHSCHGASLLLRLPKDLTNSIFAFSCYYSRDYFCVIIHKVTHYVVAYHYFLSVLFIKA